MKNILKKTKYLVFPLFLLLLLVFSTIVNFSNWQDNSILSDKKVTDSFNWDSTDSINLIKKRIEVYADTLYGLRGVFALNNNISRNDFETYVNSQNIFERYPGIFTVNYLQKVNNSDISTFVQEVKKDKSITSEDLSNFTVFPTITRNQHMIVKYVVPYKGNEKVLGLDVTSDSTKIPSLNQAIDSEKATASQPLQLFQDKEKAPLISYGIYLPVYNRNTDISTPENRQKELKGILTVTFRMNELMKNIFGDLNSYPELNFEIYDGSVIDNNLIFTRGTINSSLITISKEISIDMAGRTWIFQYTLNQRQDEYLSNDSNRTRLLNGTVINILIISMFINYLATRKRIRNS